LSTPESYPGGRFELRPPGPGYKKFRGQMKAKSDKYPAKSLITKITDVFECTPGKDAGKRVL